MAADPTPPATAATVVAVRMSLTPLTLSNRLSETRTNSRAAMTIHDIQYLFYLILCFKVEQYIQFYILCLAQLQSPSRAHMHGSTAGEDKSPGADSWSFLLVYLFVDGKDRQTDLPLWHHDTE